ncbi:MAG: YifB family Mg chelatase-like AAA ATPase [Patescibacteria group bacterium]
MSSTLVSGQVVGLKGVRIDVEIDLLPGLHRFTIVGLPDKATEEARERVSAAIKNSNFRPPQKKNHRITVNLAPADLPKEGALFDIPIALGYLRESEQLKFDPQGKFFVGELALDGTVRPVRGILPLAIAARDFGCTELFIPKENVPEASLIDGISIFEVSTLRALTDHLTGTAPITPTAHRKFVPTPHETRHDFHDIKGQEFAKRGLEIAAAGNHHVAFIGPPGTGKTLLARALASVLPPLSFKEALEITSIHSIAGSLGQGVMSTRPYRSPHHTTSYVALIGGGTIPKPGEITLAHKGVLFLDEFPEFERRVIETLREPLEERSVTVSRAKGSMNFPADIMLVAAMNPCPCGNRGSQKECVCAPRDLLRYSRKISGPIIDRIDIWLTMSPVDYKKLEEKSSGESSTLIRKRVEKARLLQQKRFSKTTISTNSQMGIKELKTFASLGEDEQQLLEVAAKKLDLSARAYHRVIKVARTIADLENSKTIKKEHLLEALRYRPHLETLE